MFRQFLVMISEIIQNSNLAVLSGKNEKNYFLYKRTLKCDYGNIPPLPVSRVLRINQRGKWGYIYYI